MENKFKKLIEVAKTFSLTKKEKQEMINKVNLFIKENPASSNSPILTPFKEYSSYKDHSTEGIVSRYFSSTFILLRNNKFVPIALLLIFMLAGGTTAAASYSLPGDMLYPVKININEKIEAALAFSVNASAKIEAKHADKRLKEAEELSTKGTLSVEVAGKIKNNFNKHAERVETLVSKLKTKGDVEDADSINSEFESALRVHQIVLIELAKKHDDDRNEIDGINGDVNIRLGSTKKVRSDRENSIITSSDRVSVQTASEGALGSANNKVAEVEKYIDARDIDSEIKIKAKTELEKSKEIIVEGKIKMDSGAYGEAFILFHRAIRKAQEAKLILKSENNLQIRIENRLSSDNDEDEDSNNKNRRENRNKQDTNNYMENEEDNSTRSKVEVKSNNEIESENNNEVEIESETKIKVELDF